ncbi:hypothetical protein D3C71_1327810 [compost metagenome]
MQTVEQHGVGMHDRCQACCGGNHVGRIAQQGTDDRAKTRADAVAGSGIEDGKRAGAGHQLEDHNGRDETAVVLDVEHGGTPYPSGCWGRL